MQSAVTSAIPLAVGIPLLGPAGSPDSRTCYSGRIKCWCNAVLVAKQAVQVTCDDPLHLIEKATC